MNKIAYLFLFAFLSFIVEAQAERLPKIYVTVIASSKNASGLPTLLQSTQRQSIYPYVVGIGDKTTSHLQDLLGHLQTFRPDDVMLIINVKNGLFLGDIDKILQRFLTLNKPVVFAASKATPKIGIYPIDLYPISPTQFQYLDSSGFIGINRNLIQIIKRIVETQPATVLDMYNLDFLSHRDYYSIDYNCKIFLSVYNVKPSDITVNLKLRNIYLKSTNSEPLILLNNDPKSGLIDSIRSQFKKDKLY